MSTDSITTVFKIYLESVRECTTLEVYAGNSNTLVIDSYT